MKKILITGANSYIGTSFADYMKQFGEEYLVDTIDMIGGEWRRTDFSKYEVIFHVAGIAHVKETKENAKLYYEVNRALAIETAKKAKQAGVKQFILLSSMSVYGIDTGIITESTVPRPKSNYGKSKLMADVEILRLSGDGFKVTVLRPPMVYGGGCKGNYQLLRKFALKFPLFPDYKNRRSMIYIFNLTDYVKTVIDDEREGVFFPQNNEYVCTTEMVRIIAKEHNKKVFISKVISPFVWLGIKMRIALIVKVFGDLVYEKSDTVMKVDFNSSLSATENVGRAE